MLLRCLPLPWQPVTHYLLLCLRQQHLQRIMLLLQLLDLLVVSKLPQSATAGSGGVGRMCSVAI
jgi:hypothetical protein